MANRFNFGNQITNATQILSTGAFTAGRSLFRIGNVQDTLNNDKSEQKTTKQDVKENKKTLPSNVKQYNLSEYEKFIPSTEEGKEVSKKINKDTLWGKNWTETKSLEEEVNELKKGGVLDADV